MFRATQDRVIEFTNAIGVQIGGVDERTADAACALLTLLRDEDSVAPLVAWAENPQSFNVLAVEGGRLVHVRHDGEAQITARAWASGEVSSVEALELGEAFPVRGTPYYEWVVTRWRIVLRDGTRLEPTVPARGAIEALKVLVRHLAP